ncbi:ECF transporter S component [Butyrivibrio sp. VCB2006]|uniref:ECF transporter S component n=1 Tax=Butyrivibrio sp. VCB2006 TaxID=1280679 RepID=UPI0003FED340|nr:ECF transporter S component [Butyrivibrio sp. VCB2006]
MKKSVFGTGQIVITAALLAICIVSQFFKNLSVFITGPIINACLIIAVLAVGLASGLVLSIITPVTAYIIAASPVMMAVPLIIPLIMAGNAVLVVATYYLLRKDLINGKGLRDIKSYVKAVICALLKGLFMGLTIALWLLPTFIPADSPLMNKLPVFQTTFSTTQFITACIGFVYAFIIWAALSRFLKNEH